MFVSTTTGAAFSPKVSLVSFRHREAKKRQEKPIKVIYEKLLLAAVAGLAAHLECHTTYTASSTVNNLF